MVYLIYVSSKSFGFVFSMEVLKTFVIISDMYFQLKNRLFSLCKATHLWKLTAYVNVNSEYGWSGIVVRHFQIQFLGWTTK